VKVLVDTCGWIEWLTDSPLAHSFESALRDVDKLIVPTAVQMELYKWLLRERNMEEAMRVINYSTQAQVVPLTQNIALTAGDLSLEHNLSFADAIVYATAQVSQATLLTSDAHFKDLAGVQYVMKQAAKSSKPTKI
jgi:predicted nucleic acid-binding protein